MTFAAGMNVSDLMAKYRLTIKGLRTAFQQLVQGSAMSKDELNNLQVIARYLGQGVATVSPLPYEIPDQNI